MIIYKINTVDEVALSSIIELVNNHDEEEQLNIYITGEGGSCFIMEAIIDILSRRKNIKLIGYGTLCSSTFEIFFKSKCEKELLPGVIGMYHLAKLNVYINEKNKYCFYEDDAKVKWVKTYMRESTKQLCKDLELTSKEIKKIENNEDVWFQYDRMCEFLKIQNKA